MLTTMWVQIHLSHPPPAPHATWRSVNRCHVKSQWNNACPKKGEAAAPEGLEQLDAFGSASDKAGANRVCKEVSTIADGVEVKLRHFATSCDTRRSGCHFQIWLNDILNGRIPLTYIAMFWSQMVDVDAQFARNRN
jgi:hypothetical protein